MTSWPLSEQGIEKAEAITPAPKINILDINYSLNINFLIKNNIATISIFPRIINVINDNLVKLFKSKKFRFSNPYNEEVVVLVRVSIDNLNAFSKSKLSKVRILDKINKEKMNEINTRKAILVSSS